jgi:galactokinase
MLPNVTSPAGSTDGAQNLAAAAEESRRLFADRFGRTPEWMAAAPGRVNLIGEHVDYNDGFVLPMAIECWVIIAAAKNNSTKARIWSEQIDATAEIELDALIVPNDPPWSEYIRGVLAGFQRRDIEVDGFDAVVHSTVPTGGGLSSSAALEVATATLLESMSGKHVGKMEKALLCQTAEHEFAGVPCGIMDQLASTSAQKGHLLLIDCRSEEFEQIPFSSDDVSVLIANTHVQHELIDGGYAARRDQCDAAAEDLLVRSLRDATLNQLSSAEARMDEVVYRRARHVVTEIERTREAAHAIRSEDWERFGELMYASHESLRDDYEVSCPELDIMVDIARSIGIEGGVYGSRLTGAGFGGCTVSLVRAEAAGRIAAAYADAYRQATEIETTIFVTHAAQCASALDHLD